MAQPTRRYFTTLTALAKRRLDSVHSDELDINPSRTVWEVHGFAGQFYIRLKEIFDQSGRKYSYYILDEDVVFVGFDNYPDRRALQQKYGREFTSHLSKLIPHKHGQRKETLELTAEMDVEMFLDYLQNDVLKNR